MANGYGGECDHQAGKTESRHDDGGSGSTADQTKHSSGLTAEQFMLGFAPVPDAEFIPDDGVAYKGRKRSRIIRLNLREYWQRFLDNICDALLFEYERGTVFLLLAVASGAGAVHYFSLKSEPYWIELFVPTCLFGWLLFLLRDTLIRRVSLVLILAFVTGMLAAKWETQRYATQMLGSSVSTTLTARIVSLEQEAEDNGKAGRWRIIADVLTTEKPHLRYAPQRLRISARDLPAQAETGSVLKGAVRLRPHGGPVRSEQYDFAFHGYFRGIGGNGFYLGVPKLVDGEFAGDAVSKSWTASIEALTGQLRAMIGGRIMQALSGEEGAVAAALISGQRAGISETTNEALRIAGLAHILSISGLHLALAAAIVMVSLRGIAGLFPSLALYYPVKKIAALISLFSSGFYLALSGADVAAQRSFIMLAVMLCAVILDRKALTLRNLAIAALFSILVTPHEILGPSFQMSYSATGALIAGFAWWKLRKRQSNEQATRQTTLGGKLRLWLGGIAATSLLAGTASGLFAAFHFNNMAPLGMLGNALALPVISVLIMPFAVLSLLLMPLGLEWLPLQVMGKGIELVKWIAHFVAGLSPDLIPGLLPVPVLLLWTAAMLSAMIFTSHLRLISLFFLMIGGIVLSMNTLPDIIISEDARLVAVRQNNSLYVNRARPTAFTIDNWRKAYRIHEVKTPDSSSAASSEGFACEDGLCSFDLQNGQVLVYAENRPAADVACTIGDIIILAYAGNLSCPDRNDSRITPAVTQNAPVIITRQQLALHGVAEIYLKPDSRSDTDTAQTLFPAMLQSATIKAQVHQTGLAYLPEQAQVVFAVGEPQRPWHSYRLWSRAARNLEDPK
ncbi:competence protein ComEC family protein [Pseudochrobactrum sp. Wa41.01b-1]|uniref:ComEC/Rec2 family competence protein n=1 Tax=Pseudochrobactrum sp. Wa41.01b-1 TaxID=2864102 RepID=UPI001C68904D|nr:ComEC/Rec2 family competence protein [Pseudochrobactrum sp. Wa41.01b-1]QYM73065.1 competence protein ComEC family protein [Pseudochrobactrum sp. Wa41.01b-1]